MGIIECVRCGKVFVPDKNTNICPECVQQENEDLKKVKDYLKDFPLANVLEVSRRTGINPAQIFRFVKYGSLRLTDAPEEFKCRMCGKEIKKGTLCQDCIDKVGELKEAQKKLKIQKAKNRNRRKR